MGIRRDTVHRVTLWSPGYDTWLLQDGFGHAYDFRDLFDRNLGQLQWVNPAAYSVYRWGGGLAPTVRLIDFPDGVTALASNHYLYTWPGQLKSLWTFHNSAAWEDSHEGTFGELWLHHFYSIYDSAVEAWAESQFDLPPEPWFGVRLWRGEQNPEDWPSTQPPYSYIEFGKEFRILIPYGGNVQVYIAGAGDSWVELEPEQGDGLAGFEGTGDDAKILRVGVLRGRIMLAYDNFGTGVAFYKIPRGNVYAGQTLRYNRYWAETTRIEPPRVWSAPVKVGHWGGEFGFTWYPLQAFLNAATPNRYACPYVPFGYYHTQAPSGVLADVWWEPRRDCWADAADLSRADSEWLIEPSVLVDTSTSETAANITFKWVPYEWTNGPALTCNMTPAVYMAQLRQPANVAATSTPASTIISPGHLEMKVEEIQVEEPEEFGPSFLRLKINDRGSTLKTLRDFQRIKVELGEKIGASSTLATVFDGHVRNPQFDSTRGAGALVQGELYGFDDVRNLVDRKHKGREPDLELLSVTEAATWLCKAGGIPAGHINISTVMDTVYLHAGTRKSHAWGYSIEGHNGQQRWQARFGADFLPTLRDIAQHTNSQWYWTANARTVNLTNGYWPTAGYQYDCREHNAPSSAYGIYKWDPDRRTVDDEDFANYVHLRGRTDAGAPLDAVVWDASSLWSKTAWNYTHGRRIEYVETRDDVRNLVALWSLAYSKLSQLSGRPRGAKAETDLIPALRRGQIIRTSGLAGGRLDDCDALSQRYLVTGYVHRWWRGQVARTTTQLKWAGTAT